MRYGKRYIQFNDLVFDHVDMISADDLNISFKRKDTPYTFRHGSYVAHHSRAILAEAADFSMTITLYMKKLPCEVRKWYPDFVKAELSKVGRLWAISNDTLVWAWAELNSFGEKQDDRRDRLDYDVDVYLPEGIWHKADPQKTFLYPWDICEFMDCLGYRDETPCLSENCCDCSDDIKDAGCDCCECLTRDMALCYHMDELQDFYGCKASYRIVYDCEAANRLFDGLTHYLGQKLCSDCGLIAGRLYSNTDMDSDYVRITIHGHVKNPRININGNANMIRGEYEYLVINPDGSVQYGTCESNCTYLLDVDKWVVPRSEGMEYGWTIHPGENSVIIDTNNCCGTVCAYFELDPITM